MRNIKKKKSNGKQWKDQEKQCTEIKDNEKHKKKEKQGKAMKT